MHENKEEIILYERKPEASFSFWQIVWSKYRTWKKNLAQLINGYANLCIGRNTLIETDKMHLKLLYRQTKIENNVLELNILITVAISMSLISLYTF